MLFCFFIIESFGEKLGSDYVHSWRVVNAMHADHSEVCGRSSHGGLTSEPFFYSTACSITRRASDGSTLPTKTYSPHKHMPTVKKVRRESVKLKLTLFTNARGIYISIHQLSDRTGDRYSMPIPKRNLRMGSRRLAESPTQG